MNRVGSEGIAVVVDFGRKKNVFSSLHPLDVEHVIPRRDEESISVQEPGGKTALGTARKTGTYTGTGCISCGDTGGPRSSSFDFSRLGGSFLRVGGGASLALPGRA